MVKLLENQNGGAPGEGVAAAQVRCGGPGGQEGDDILRRQRRLGTHDRLRVLRRAVDEDVDIVILHVRDRLDIELGHERIVLRERHGSVGDLQLREGEGGHKIFDSDRAVERRRLAGATEVQVDEGRAVGQIPLDDERVLRVDFQRKLPVAQRRRIDRNIGWRRGRRLGRGAARQLERQDFDFLEEPALGDADVARDRGCCKRAGDPDIRIRTDGDRLVAQEEIAFRYEVQIDAGIEQIGEEQAARDVKPAAREIAAELLEGEPIAREAQIAAEAVDRGHVGIVEPDRREIDAPRR